MIRNLVLIIAFLYCSNPLAIENIPLPTYDYSPEINYLSRSIITYEDQLDRVYIAIEKNTKTLDLVLNRMARTNDKIQKLLAICGKMVLDKKCEDPNYKIGVDKQIYDLFKGLSSSFTEYDAATEKLDYSRAALRNTRKDIQSTQKEIFRLDTLAKQKSVELTATMTIDQKSIVLKKYHLHSCFKKPLELYKYSNETFNVNNQCIRIEHPAIDSDYRAVKLKVRMDTRYFDDPVIEGCEIDKFRLHKYAIAVCDVNSDLVVIGKASIIRLEITYWPIRGLVDDPILESEIRFN